MIYRMRSFFCHNGQPECIRGVAWRGVKPRCGLNESVLQWRILLRCILMTPIHWSISSSSCGGQSWFSTCVGDSLYEHDQNCLLADTWNILLGLRGHTLNTRLPSRHVSVLDFIYVIWNSGKSFIWSSLHLLPEFLNAKKDFRKYFRTVSALLDISEQ
jgi:hypothetical protein